MSQLCCEYENLEIGGLLTEAEKEKLCALQFHGYCNMELYGWSIWAKVAPNSVDRNKILSLFL